jgi:hypothetical protein
MGFLEISTHQPSRPVTAVTLGLQYPLESMALEECDGSDVTTDRVHATARSVGRIALDYLCAVASGVRDSAVKRCPSGRRRGPSRPRR